MPATSGTYKMYELQIYDKLISAGLNTAAACGILSNLYAESGFNPNNLQNSYEHSLGYNDLTYTRAVDNKTYMKFDTDRAGYGIAQWTDSSRKIKLYQYAMRSNSSIGELSMQIDFLLYELQQSYKSLWTSLSKISNNSQGAYDAGYDFCRDFERPAGGVDTYKTRGDSARDLFWKYYSQNPKESARAVISIGSKIVEIAKKQIGKPYIEGGYLYDNGLKGADSPGLVHYCYKEAGVDIPLATTDSYYRTYKSNRKVNLSGVSAGDLVFYDTDQSIGNDIEIIAIATGEGTVIYADKESGKIVSMPIGSPALIIRLLADSETSSSTSSEGWSDLSSGEYTGLSYHDPNVDFISANLSRVSAEGYDLGYLIDMTNGGVFRFYIPEFTESAGASWSPIEIRGRSVQVLSYENTASRKISISLDLYAGMGVYAATSGESGEDTVSRLHNDANFLKSLEYPDYSVAIARPPATVHLLLGAAVDIVGVVSDVTIEHLKPLDAQNRAMYMKVNFTVTQTAVNPPDYRDIRAGQSSIVATADINSLLKGTTVSDNKMVSSLSTSSPRTQAERIEY